MWEGEPYPVYPHIGIVIYKQVTGELINGSFLDRAAKISK